jgi:hypothetical protein
VFVETPPPLLTNVNLTEPVGAEPVFGLADETTAISVLVPPEAPRSELVALSAVVVETVVTDTATAVWVLSVKLL